MAVPGEVHFHASMLIGVNLFAGRANNYGGLWPLDDGLGGNARSAELLGFVNGAEAAREELPLAFAAVAGKLARVGVHRDFGEEVFAVLVGARVLLELEGGPRGEAAGTCVAVQCFVLGLEFVQAHIGQAVAFSMIDVFPWKIVDLVFGFAIFALHVG